MAANVAGNVRRLPPLRSESQQTRTGIARGSAVQAIERLDTRKDTGKNKVNIHCILITYAIDPAPLLKFADGNDITWHVFMHSRNQAVWDAVIDFESKWHFEMYDYGENRGLARSWGEGIRNALRMGADAIIVVNDDVLASHEDIFKLAQTCLDHPEAGIVTAWGFNERMGDVRDNGYSLFGINPIAIEKVGYFDTNYLVLYGEDVDMSRRCALAGVPFYSCTETNIYHKGSATTNSVPALTQQHQVTFPRNEAYHRLKHGGGYGQEVFLHPFNDPALSWKISAENMENPYPGHQRDDLDIVKV